MVETLNQRLESKEQELESEMQKVKACNNSIEALQDASEKIVQISFFISKNREMIKNVMTKTGEDLGNAEIKSFENDKQGEYDSQSKQISLDENNLETANLEDTLQVGMHEAKHTGNNKKSRGIQLIDPSLNEDLASRATEKETGVRKEYKELEHKTKEILKATRVSESELVDLFNRGINDEINSLIIHTRQKQMQKVA